MHAAALYEAHCGTVDRVVRAIARRYGLSRADADDFSQDAWVHLLRNEARALNAFRGQSAMQTYLWKILFRRYPTWQRIHGHQEHPSVVYGNLAEHTTRSVPLVGSVLDDHLAEARARDLARALERQIDLLDTSDRELLCLRFIHGMQASEIGNRRGSTRASVYKRLERVLRKLRESLSSGGFGARDVAEVLESRRFTWSEASLIRERAQARPQNPEPRTQNPEPKEQTSPRLVMSLERAA
jgi:RNA polymerase sigma factor (sigma-70 family)